MSGRPDTLAVPWPPSRRRTSVSDVLRVSDLRALSSFSVQALRGEIGPFTLIQRPPDPVLAKVAVELASARTVVMAHRSRLAEQILTMLRGFDDLLVVAPKIATPRAILTIGR